MMAILNNRLDVSTLVDGLDHAEGVAWGLDGFAYAGGEAGQVYRVDVERGELSQFAQVTGGFILGMALELTTTSMPATRAVTALFA
jgi:gluconolactonase